MGEQDFESLIETLKSIMSPQESKFTLSMATAISILLAMLSGLGVVVSFLVVGYYSNFSEIKMNKLTDDGFKVAIVEIKSDMKELRASQDRQNAMLNEIRNTLTLPIDKRKPL